MLLSEYLHTSRKFKKIALFIDIETFQYNQKRGRKEPSRFKNQVFSCAVSYILPPNNNIDYEIFPNFIEMFSVIENEKLTTQTQVELWIHNGNKYDNHYLLYQLLNTYSDIRRFPRYVKNSEDNAFTETFKSLKIKKGEKAILEKRVKSKTNVELEFTLGSCKYATVDTIPKTGGRSLNSLGKTMNKLGLMDDKYLKTTIDYEKYNLDKDMTYVESYDLAYNIYKNLSSDELTYIANDVIILAYLKINFSKMFTGFDIDKITFSQNILEEYKTSPLSIFQLTSKFKSMHVKYTEYDFRGQSLYDYLKQYYKGGLNIYNDDYVGKLISHRVLSFDRNSSYPDVMYNCKVPTYLLNSSDQPELIPIPDYDENYFNMFEISVDEFNRLLDLIPSKMIRKAIVKYYSNIYDNYYINTNTLKLISLFSPTPPTKLKTLSRLTWECRYFDARNVLADNYFKKTQGKAKMKLIMNSPSDFVETNEPNTLVFSQAEIDTSKVINNGIYGLPALRAYYNMFKYNPHNNTLESLPASFRNNERNMIFSIFTTSMAFYRLLVPLKDLSPKEIDKYWYYADTDSLYLDDRGAKKVNPSIMHEMNLGYWKNEHIIKGMYILNHKKYAMNAIETGTPKIIIRSGGIRSDSFDTDMPFEQFINSQFTAGAVVTTTKSILTRDGTMALYPSKTNLDVGMSYQEKGSKIIKEVMKKIAINAKEEIVNSDEDALYIETPFGAISVNEVVSNPFELTNRDIKGLIQLHKMIKHGLS